MDPRPPLRSYYERAVSNYKETARGRCSTCGFLTKAISPTDDAEIRAIERDAGIDAYGKVPLSFFCFVNAQPIRNELVIPIAPGKTEQSAVLEIFQRDRKCADWYPYRPGASPLWHYEDMRMMYLEEARAQRERETSAIQAQIQADHKAIAADSLKIAQALKDAQDATGRFTTKWTYIAVAVAAVALLLVGVAYVFPALGPTIGHAIFPSWAPTPKP